MGWGAIMEIIKKMSLKQFLIEQFPEVEGLINAIPEEELARSPYIQILLKGDNVTDEERKNAH